jgi:hypothetical protein
MKVKRKATGTGTRPAKPAFIPALRHKFFILTAVTHWKYASIMKRVPGSCAVNLMVCHPTYSYLNKTGITLNLRVPNRMR